MLAAAEGGRRSVAAHEAKPNLEGTPDAIVVRSSSSVSTRTEEGLCPRQNPILDERRLKRHTIRLYLRN